MQIHGKEITTIISDLDGTLLGQEESPQEQRRELNPAVFGLIRRLEEKGVSFVAASGRQYKNMRLLFEPIVKGHPFVCENGSVIVKDEEIIYAGYIPRELCFALLDDMLSMPGAETIVSSEMSIYTLADRESFIERMNKFLRPRVEVIEDYSQIEGRINKISIWWPDGIPEKEEKWFHEKYDDKLQATDSGNGWLDFTMKHVNKGTALQRLAELEGFSLEEALCFGDSENDVTMFRECGISYAMSMSREHVKAEADYVCTDVIETLRSFLAEDGTE